MLRSLLDPVFNPSESVSTPFLHNCVFLLALAASTQDDRSVLWSARNSDDDNSDDAPEVHVNEAEVDKTKQALQVASSICKSDNTLGYNVSLFCLCV